MGAEKHIAQSRHTQILVTFTSVRKILHFNPKRVRLSYRKVLFNDYYDGEYYTHSFEILMNDIWIGTAYGEEIYNTFYIVTRVRKQLKPVCKLERIKNYEKKYFKL